MLTAATGKHQLMIRKAGTPISSIKAEASKSSRNCSAKIWNSTVPTLIMATAYRQPQRRASSTRFRFRAP